VGRRSLCCCQRPTELKESPEAAAARKLPLPEKKKPRTASRCRRRPDAYRKPLLPPSRSRTASRRSAESSLNCGE
jgi:hypothetical protein